VGCDVIARSRRETFARSAISWDIDVSWVCPRCQRTFSVEGQFHSHDVVDLDWHFAGRPAELRATFDTLVASLSADVRVEPLKTAIILAARTTFAYVVVRRDRLLVGVFLDRPLDSPRVTKIDHVSSSKIGNVIELRASDQVDDELCSWLGEAHNIRSVASRRR
jgi:hypothetical protein